MELNEFTLIKNRVVPEFNYQYKKVKNGYKYQITTMDGGKSFLATIESKGEGGKRYYSDYSGNFKSLDEALIAINKYKKWE